jgi:hypothetical protein
MTKYQYGWRDWCGFVNQQGRTDHYMKSASRHSKVRQLVNFFRERYGRGLREKQATGVGAAIRKFFEVALQDTEWLDDPQVKIARRACRRSALENRAYVRSRAGRDKKPIWYELVTRMREEYWEGKDYSCDNIDSKMVAPNAMFSYDLALRRGESNITGDANESHTLLNEDLTFILREPVDVGGGGDMRSSMRGGSAVFRQHVVAANVIGCNVWGVTHKVGLIRAGKMIEARTEEEELLLMDLVDWVLHLGLGPEDPVFSRYTQFPGKPRMKKVCIPSMVVKALKALVKDAGLDPKEFSLHSLRSGCATQLNAHGIGQEEANARGNWAQGSTMVQTVYNGNDTGRGALSSSSSGIGRRVGVKDVSRLGRVAYDA